MPHIATCYDQALGDTRLLCMLLLLQVLLRGLMLLQAAAASRRLRSRRAGLN
jgi:hypothetical protein